MNDKLKEREAFEAWFSDQGQYPKAIQRRDDGYLLSTAQSAWVTWQARAAIDAALAARGAVPAGWREAMTNLLWAATERDKKNRIRQFDEFVDAARELLAAAPQQVAQPSEPVHFRAMLDPAQIPHQLKTSMHVCGFRTLKAAEAFVAEQTDFYGWNYTIEPLYAAPVAQAKPEQAAQPHKGMTVAGNGAQELGALMREQWANRGCVYPDGNPNAGGKA